MKYVAYVTYVVLHVRDVRGVGDKDPISSAEDLSRSMRINQGLDGGQPAGTSDPWGWRTVTGPVWSARSGEVFQRTGPKLAN